MSIYITGDTHGDIDIGKLTTKNFGDIKKTLTRNDYIIICGDVAVCWDGGKFDRYIQNWWCTQPYTLLFVDGNHENHDLLDAYPVTEWNGGKIHEITPNVFHLMRGQYYTIEGSTFFTFGGAESTDKWHRKEGRSWWAREMPSDEEYNEGFKNLEMHNNTVDYIITHDAPNKIVEQEFEWRFDIHNKIRNYFDIINETVSFKEWHFGHYHQSIKMENGKYQCHYYEVKKLV